MRDNFLQKTKDILAKRVSYICSNPICRKNTSGPNTDENKSVSIGVAAHITAASKGGPRYNEKMTDEERKSISNGIWLCQNCASLIDKDEIKFPVSLLNKWKDDTERFVLKKIGDKKYDDELNKKILKLIKDLQSKKSISEIISEIFELSILYGFEDLREISTREINGWYSSELPPFDEIDLPEYRMKDVLVTIEKIKVHVLHHITIDEFLHELKKKEYAFEIRYLFPDPIREIENSIEKIEEPDLVMSQEFSPTAGLKVGDYEIDVTSWIWFKKSNLTSLIDKLKGILNRKLIEKISK